MPTRGRLVRRRPPEPELADPLVVYWTTGVPPANRDLAAEIFFQSLERAAELEARHGPQVWRDCEPTEDDDEPTEDNPEPTHDEEEPTRVEPESEP